MKLKLKITVFFIALCFIIPSFAIGNEYSTTQLNSECYGFIVSNNEYDFSTQETFEISRLMHLINDLLRAGIEVYRSNMDFNVLCSSLSDFELQNRFFLKGSFIIPFTGDEYTDGCITSMIHDYNSTHEVNSHETTRVQSYVICEQVLLSCDRLVQPKIVQQYDQSVRYNWPTYFEIAEAGGFYEYDFLLDDEAATKLNNEDFNVYVWSYKSDSAWLSEIFFSIVNADNINAVRDFVANGGGYIGTCLGTYAASSGFIIPGLFNRLQLAYSPGVQRSLPGIALSISDTFMWNYVKAALDLTRVEITITDVDHPLFYGVKPTYLDFYKGPVFGWIGPQTEVLGVISDIQTFDGDPINDTQLKNVMINRPCWIHSRFGGGEVVLFASHPDFVNNIYPLFHDAEWPGDSYHGRRLIYNAFFYTTSEKNIIPNLIYFYDVHTIKDIMNMTDNIHIPDSESNDFNDIINDINIFKNSIDDFHLDLLNISNLFSVFLIEHPLYPESNRFLSYSLYYTNVSKEYFNKTISNLHTIDQLQQLLHELNVSVDETIDEMKWGIQQNITCAKNIFTKVYQISQQIQLLLSQPDLPLVEKFDLLEKTRTMLNTYQIEIKYIPQIFFISEMMKRDMLYRYEALLAIK